MTGTNRWSWPEWLAIATLLAAVTALGSWSKAANPAVMTAGAAVALASDEAITAVSVDAPMVALMDVGRHTPMPD